jgi:hypothetical protein
VKITYQGQEVEKSPQQKPDEGQKPQ